MTLFNEIENDFIKRITDHLNVGAPSQEMLFDCLNDQSKRLQESKNLAKTIINHLVSG